MTVPVSAGTGRTVRHRAIRSQGPCARRPDHLLSFSLQRCRTPGQPATATRARSAHWQQWMTRALACRRVGLPGEPDSGGASSRRARLFSWPYPASSSWADGGHETHGKHQASPRTRRPKRMARQAVCVPSDSAGHVTVQDRLVIADALGHAAKITAECASRVLARVASARYGVCSGRDS